MMAVAAIRFFEPTANVAKTINVHGSFPILIRLAYGWLLIAAALSIWASRAGEAPGTWGASQRALAVGFIFDEKNCALMFMCDLIWCREC